jgi:hypothetical protein
MTADEEALYRAVVTRLHVSVFPAWARDTGIFVREHEASRMVYVGVSAALWSEIISRAHDELRAPAPAPFVYRVELVPPSQVVRELQLQAPSGEPSRLVVAPPAPRAT